MNYEQSVAYIHGKYGKGVKAGLENMTRLLARLGDPHKGLRCIHVAGTNGKGSTCAFIDSMLRAAGARVGLYTSPFLMRYNERMRVDGAEIPDETVARLTTRIEKEVRAMEESGEGFPTVFEIGTALMFCWFAEEKVDWAVVEVGLGGRLDPTNVLDPAVCVVTRIGLDHMKVLGDTIEKIAAEKGGIIKKGVPVVLQRQDPRVRGVIEGICREKRAPLFDCAEVPLSDVRLDERGARFTAAFPHIRRQEFAICLCGRHQVDNAVTALAAVSALMEGHCIPAAAISQGLAAARWPGRLEWMDNVLLDGAHNPQGAAALADYARACLSGRRILLLTGMMADKDVAHAVDAFAPLAASVLCVRPERMARAMPAQDLAALYRERTGAPVQALPDTRSALRAAKQSAGPGDIILVCGSLYLVGEVRRLLLSGNAVA